MCIILAGLSVRLPVCPPPSTGITQEKSLYKKWSPKGRPHIGIYTLQIGSFSPNTATKFHGRRQPCRGILSCLVKKSLVLECFAVLNGRFFFTAATGDRVNTGCIPRETGAVVEEKIHSKPCKSLCESAQSFSFCFSPSVFACGESTACGRPGRGSDSPPDCHSLPRLRFAYP